MSKKIDATVEGKTVLVHAKQVVPDKDLDYDDREGNIPGTYEVVVPADTPKEIAAAIALDAFATSTPIVFPEHFEVWATLDGEHISEDGNLETYTRDKDTLYGIQKISDTTEG